MKIWSTTEWKELPERIRDKAFFSVQYWGKAYLFQDEGMDEPVVIDPRWQPFATVVEVLEFQRASGQLHPMIPLLPKRV